MTIQRVLRILENIKISVCNLVFELTYFALAKFCIKDEREEMQLVVKAF